MPSASPARDFLNREYYGPLSDAINEHVYVHLVNNARCAGEPPATCIVDVGCGEGYYIGRLKRHLDGRLERDDICYFGLIYPVPGVR